MPRLGASSWDPAAVAQDQIGVTDEVVEIVDLHRFADQYLAAAVQAFMCQLADVRVHVAGIDHPDVRISLAKRAYGRIDLSQSLALIFPPVRGQQEDAGARPPIAALHGHTPRIR